MNDNFEISMKANHLPLIYSLIGYIFFKVEPVFFGFNINPIYAMIFIYLAITVFYYKYVIAYSKNLSKKILGIKEN